MNNDELAEVLKDIGLQREQHYQNFDKLLEKSESRIEKTGHMQEMMLQAFKESCALSTSIMQDKDKEQAEMRRELARVRDDYERRLNQSIDFRNRLQDQNDKLVSRIEWLEEENSRLSKILENQLTGQRGTPTTVTVGDFKSAQK